MAKDNPPTGKPATSATPAKSEKLVRVYHTNRTKRSFLHGDHRLDPGGSTVVPESVAALWAEHKFYGEPEVSLNEEQAMPTNVAALQKETADAKAGEAKANEEVARLNEQLTNLEKLLAAEKGKAAGGSLV